MALNPEIREETHDYFNEMAPVLLFILTPMGDIIHSNRYARDLTGRSLLGENFRHVIVDFTGKFNLNELVSEPTTEWLLNIATASGVPQSFYFTFKPVGDRILAFGRLDAEEIEKMRKEVLSLNQELNNLMRELQKKNAQLKRLNAEKNRFLGMASHDLRKPIGLVITYSEFLIDEAKSVLDEEQIGFLNTINRSCLFMKRLVDDFLDVSAIEAGRFELDLQSASINTILSHSLRLNNLQALKKGIDLEVLSDDSLPHVLMDTSKIEQAITNLVSNAIEHTNPDTSVVVRLIKEEESIVFSVKDSGPGIPPGEMDRLFKPFEKTSAKKTGGEKSTGLGMAITRKIIETHGGTIWIESLLGEGTTVYFNIPIERKYHEPGNNDTRCG